MDSINDINDPLRLRFKPRDRNFETGTGYSHKWSWVAYNPDTKAFYSAADDPPCSACRVHECRECERHPQADKLPDNEAPFRFSPVHVPSDIEKAYLVTLADWWKKEQGTVHVMDTRPPKERRVADVDTESIQRSRYNRVFVNVIVEVSNNLEANCACMTQISSIGYCYNTNENSGRARNSEGARSLCHRLHSPPRAVW